MITNTSKVPRLRYSEYSQDWNDMLFGNILKLVSREVPKPNKEYLSIGIRSHFKGTFQKPNTKPESIALDRLYLVKKGDLIVNITFAWEGALAIVKDIDDGGLVSHRFPTYELNKNKILPEYFQFVFPTKRMKYDLETISPGGAGRNRVLRKNDFLKLKIKAPSIEEQQKIADFLGSVDRLIENLEKQKEAIETYKNGMMQKIFSRQIRFKDDNGNDFPEWTNLTLGEIASFSKGKGLSKNEITEDGKHKCIHYGELYTKYKRLIAEIDSKTDLQVADCVLSEPNDVLMPTSDVTPTGLATASALNEKGVILGGDILIIRSKQLNNLFFSYYVEANKQDVMRLVNGVTVYHLYGSDLSTMNIVLPRLDEQQKIAEVLSSIDLLIQSKESQISKAKQWKKGLLQQMFV